MRIKFRDKDIEEIARRMAGILKPLLIENNENKPLRDDLLSVGDAAQFLKTSKSQIYQWVNNSQHGLGDLPYLKAGRLLRFSKNAVLQWLQKHQKTLEIG